MMTLDYMRYVLDNGLTVILHQDNETAMAAVNLLYKVGARNESPERTGLAHLFEHLMFGGTEAAPNFDVPIQTAGGENNAFTNSDVTNFYDTVPAANLETALWIEADRMMNLKLDFKALDTQRKVVVEEFSETCLNQPYGDVWHKLRHLCYKKHPYRWPTIGLVPEHIKETNLDNAHEFYNQYYSPNNAILVVAGGIDINKTKQLIEQYFGNIPAAKIQENLIEQEPEQTEARELDHQALVPVNALYIAFKSAPRNSREFYIQDLISDIFSNGRSARLYTRLVKNQQLFNDIDCYVTANYDPGLVIVDAKLSPSISYAEAEAAIWNEIDQLCTTPPTQRELDKVVNKAESSIRFGNINAIDKAMNIAYYEALGDITLLNREVDIYRSITPQEIMQGARDLFNRKKSNTLRYKANTIQHN